MKKLKKVPLEEFIDSLLKIYEEGYEFADISLENNNISISGVGDKTPLEDDLEDDLHIIYNFNPN